MFLHEAVGDVYYGDLSIDCDELFSPRVVRSRTLKETCKEMDMQFHSVRTVKQRIPIECCLGFSWSESKSWHQTDPLL